MESGVEIFDIGRKDLHEITQMARDYFAELEPFDEALRMEPDWEREYHEMLLMGLSARPFFMRGARADGRTVGFVMFSYRVEQMWSIAVRGYISNIYVVPEYRRRGIGRLLVADALARLRMAGAQSVEMEVLRRQRPGHGVLGQDGLRALQTTPPFLTPRLAPRFHLFVIIHLPTLYSYVYLKWVKVRWSPR